MLKRPKVKSKLTKLQKWILDNCKERPLPQENALHGFYKDNPELIAGN